MYFHDISPTDLRQEYEARVAAAVLRHNRATAAQQEARPRWVVWAAVRNWLTTVRTQLERSMQPAEEGYIA